MQNLYNDKQQWLQHAHLHWVTVKYAQSISTFDSVVSFRYGRGIDFFHLSGCF